MRNTLMLYFRMFLSMGISLYTSRLVLKELGVIDYGIYNVVASMVLMFGLVSNTLQSATLRFLSVELGRDNKIELGKNFSVALQIYALAAIVILGLAESLGLYLIFSNLQIPDGRQTSAQLIFHFSVISFILKMMVIPFGAAMLAREKMGLYAGLQLGDTLLRFMAAIMLTTISHNRLEVYGLMIMCTSFLAAAAQAGIAMKQFPECRYRACWEKNRFFSMLNFSGWNLFGSTAGVLSRQGLDLLINIFFGPALNAAKGVAHQVSGAVMQFGTNFHQAVRPQIIKLYAAEEREAFYTLVFRSSKMTFFLLFIMALPLLHAMPFVMELWLDKVPALAATFARWLLLVALIDSLSYSLMTSAQATGRIALYQGLVGGLLLTTMPVTYLCYKLGASPLAAFYVPTVVSAASFGARLLMLKKLIDLNITRYLKRVLLPVVAVVLIANIPYLFWLHAIEFTIPNLLLLAVIDATATVLPVWTIGFSSSERRSVFTMVRARIGRWASK